MLRSPGTAAAGLVLLDGHRLTGRADFLAAARRTGDLLIDVQLGSGGWVSEMPVNGGTLAWWFDAVWWRITIDDDVTPGAVRLLLALWETTGEERYRAAAGRAIELLLGAQLASGAWPIAWRPDWIRGLAPDFSDLGSLNDGATTAALETLLVGARVLERPDLHAAARRAGDWLLRVQLPPPHAGWTQQYDADDRPAAARAFEPPALTSWESRYAVEALLALAVATGDRRYCGAVAEAVAWLERSALRAACWARFYGLEDEAPLYLASDGRRVGTPAEARPGYSWTGDFGIPSLLDRLGRSVPGTRERPVAGDPGLCPGEAPHGFDRSSPEDPRALVAQAGLLMAAIAPPGPSPCDPSR